MVTGWSEQRQISAIQISEVSNRFIEAENTPPTLRDSKH
jgi:hypothetical protein